MCSNAHGHDTTVLEVYSMLFTASECFSVVCSLQSSAFGFLLASMHFGDFLVRVPSAVSVVWMAVMGSSMAVFWRFIPIKEESKTSTA